MPRSSSLTGRFALVAAVVALAGLSGCKREETFDERYANVQARIQKSAAEIDKRIAATGDAAQEGVAVESSGRVK